MRMFYLEKPEMVSAPAPFPLPTSSTFKCSSANPTPKKTNSAPPKPCRARIWDQGFGAKMGCGDFDVFGCGV